MRTRIVFLVCLSLLAVLSARVATPAASPAKVPYRATLKAPTHVPLVNSKWRFTVTVKGPDGKALPASLRVYSLENGRRVDTIGWFGMKGTFSKTIRWHPTTRGRSLTFRVVVIATGGQTKLSYWVKPR